MDGQDGIEPNPRPLPLREGESSRRSCDRRMAAADMMMSRTKEMRGVALNFFPLETRDFAITLYRLPYVEGKRPKVSSEEAVRRSLEVDGIRDLLLDAVSMDRRWHGDGV